MKRNYLFAGFVWGAILLFGPVQSGAQDNAQEILDRAIQALGGPSVIMQKLLLPAEKNVTTADVDAVVNLIMGDRGMDATVMFRNRSTIIHAGETMKLQCRSDVGLLDKRRPAVISTDSVGLPEGLEIPDSLLTLKAGMNSKVHVQIRNSSDHDIVLPKETMVGKLEMVSSVTPVPLRKRVEASSSDQPQNRRNDQEVSTIRAEDTTPTDDRMHEETRVLTEHQKEVLHTIDLSELTTEQQGKVRELIIQEAESFSTTDNDVGCIQSPKMRITLNDDDPVQLKYNRIPRPLYTEIKAYIEDLLNKQWIQKSHSNFLSPIVTVRKKDGSLRLCCDYRKLNAKTTQDRHPLPNIQDSLDALGGNHFFSVLDQCKAYHQMHLEESSRHLTAFVTPWGLYEWVRIPFGTHQRTSSISTVYGELSGGFPRPICTTIPR